MRRLLAAVLVLAACNEPPPKPTCPCNIPRGDAGAAPVVTGATFTEPAPETPAPPVDPDVKFAELGACKLESGQTIEPCRVGYRTFGTLDAKKSNAVLWGTWFTGTTKDLVDLVPAKLVDPKKFFLVMIDSLGDGVTSAPSNSTTQPRLSFPVFTIHDMVVVQHRLAVETLGLTHVRAVGGISMGGMQSIEFAVAEPEFMDKVISIVGSPQLTSYDLLLWTTMLHALEVDPAYEKGNYRGRPQMRTLADVFQLNFTTPAQFANTTKREKFRDELAKAESDVTFDWNDMHRQLEAMIAHDITKSTGGTLDSAAKHIKAKTLFVVSDQDHIVSPIPARALAKAMGQNAKLVALEGPCGHVAVECETPKVAGAIRDFL